MINQQKFEQLREILDTSKNFGDIMTFFFDHFADDRSFSCLGQSEEVPLLTSRLEHVLGLMTKKKAKLVNARYVRIAEFRFVHGPFFMQGQPGSVIYFEDTGKGLVAFADKNGVTNCARFSTSHFVDPEKVELN